MFTPLSVLALSASVLVASLLPTRQGLIRSVAAQQDFTSNATGFSGTWSTGSGAVVTGPSFADPMNNDKPFNYPANTGIAFSFTDDGYFEEAQYRFEANASHPQCSTAVVIWQHGKYYFHNNGSLTLDPSPFEADGRIQVQDPCAPTTEVLTYYSQFELYNGWSISIDKHHAAYMLQLYRFDGSLFPRLYLTVRPPTMLPTTSLEAVYNGSVPAR
ncbi:uncharacterized protein JCM15063_004816 [Sporobolomyces koalae]|uniref:uncharacterized protein n=1 Tax=Sporobolomyces koalae TaxID=500713 RepID=UPI003170B0E7